MKDTFAKNNGSCKDYVGKKYGMLTATRPISKRKSGGIVWEFLCECGKVVERLPSQLAASVRRGNASSCGCSQRKDYTGKKYGKLTAIKPTGSKNAHGGIIWEFLCECGKVVERVPVQPARSIKRGETPSCGCSRRYYRGEDYTGKKYGALTATKPTSKSRNGCIIWEFLCECGNTVERTPSYLKVRLKTGNIPSCGCHRKRDFLDRGMTEDYTLQKYGMIILTTPTSKVRGRYVVWEGICECGKLVERIPRNLEGAIREGSVPNCGCKNRLPKYTRARNSVLWQYKRRAKKKGLEFRLTDDEAFALFEGKCHYCNTLPSSNIKIWNGKGNSLREVYLYNGIDRINNDEGYNPSNCVPCCGRCNSGKGDSGADEFLQRIIKIYNHLFEDG